LAFPAGFRAAGSKADYWKELEAGHCAIRRIKDVRWRASDDKILHGGWLEDIDCFDPEYFNLSSQDAAIMDPRPVCCSNRVRLRCRRRWDAPKDLAGEKVGV